MGELVTENKLVLNFHRNLMVLNLVFTMSNSFPHLITKIVLGGPIRKKVSLVVNFINELRNTICGLGR